MKTKARPSLPHRQSTRGFALMLVLAMLVLISVAAISFFSSVTTELRATKAYSEGVESTRLSDTAVSLVMAEITAATSAGSINNPVSWASQPGMIRTWDNQGQLNGIYKLYSWKEMIRTANGSALAYDPYAATELPPATWDDDTAHYVDLNEPLNGIFPILDPTAESIVEGFEINETDQVLDGKENLGAMPVQWLYMLQDGTIESPTNSSGTTATIAGASTNNPIVARIAFWTDDETAKVNLNTASEMAFWDTPRTNYEEERGSEKDASPYWPGFDASVPIDREFQRYPGHPATTSLSPIFGSVLPRPDYIQNSGDYDQLEKYYDIAPRIATGGTEGGSKPVFVGRNNYQDAIPAMQIDADRLYASTGELLFGPGDQLQAGEGRQSRTQSALLDTTGFDADLISKTKFFLTTSSRAPDENLFNLPRVSIWPLQDDSVQTGVRNAKDQLMAFAATLSGNPYYFQRYKAFMADGAISGEDSSQSPTDDYQEVSRNQELLGDYLLELTKRDIPGFGGNFSTKYSNDNAQILVQFFDFIRSNVNTNSQSLDPKYSYAPTDPDDMKSIRGFNSIAPTRITLDGEELQGFGRTRYAPEVSIVFAATGFKDETDLRTVPVDHDLDPATPPIQVPTWDGTTPITQPKPANAEGDGLPDDEPAGSMEEPLELSTSGVDFLALPADQWTPDASFDGIGDPRLTSIRAFVIVKLDTLSPGAPMFNPALRVQIEGLDSLQIGYDGLNYTLGFPSGDNAIALSSPASDHSLMPRSGTHSLLRHTGEITNPVNGEEKNVTNWGRELAPHDGVAEGNNAEDEGTRYYPFVGQEVTFSTEPAAPMPWAIAPPDADGGWEGSEQAMLQGKMVTARPNMRRDSLYFSGGEITVNIYNGYEADPDLSDEDNLYQSYTIDMPGKTIPLPEIVREKPTANGPWLQGADRDNPTGIGGIRTIGFYTGVHPLTQSVLDPFDLSLRFGAYVSGPGISGIEHPADDNPGLRSQWKKTHTYGRWGATPPHIRMGDVVLTYGLDPNGPSGGDPRLLAGRKEVGEEWFSDIGDGSRRVRKIRSNSRTGDDWEVHRPTRQAHSFHFIEPDGNDQSRSWGYLDRGENASPPVDKAYDLDDLVNTNGTLYGYLVGEPDSDEQLEYLKTNNPNAIIGTEGAFNLNGQPGDWDTGAGGAVDGPYINKAEEGFAAPAEETYWSIYFPANDVTLSGSGRNATIFAMSYSPTRQIPSPIQMGSLPTGVLAQNPWTTLAFSPNPAAKSTHPGLVDPPDHLYLDLFTMPIPEPYAISEPFATAGRVNLNYAIQPFPFIKRATGIHALMKDVKIPAIHDSLSDYKDRVTFGGKQSIRYGIDVDETLIGFERILNPSLSDQPGNTPDLFRSASQICEIFLVPKLQDGPFEYQGSTASLPTTYADTATWWDSFRRTGDNLREAPYNHLYSRVTTKSNTYTVHWRVQSLKKTTGTPPDEWVEGVDRIFGEKRGSTTIERYIDPNATDIPDYATELTNDPTPLHEFYRWRVVNTRKFNP